MKIIPIINPIAPITAIPNAEIFATFQNSFFEGFFITLNTLTHCPQKVFNDILIRKNIRLFKSF